MSGYIKFRWGLMLLRKKLNKNEKAYKALLDEARRGKKSRDDIEAINSEASHFYFSVREEIQLLITKYYIELSDKLLIPLPERSDEQMWEECIYVSTRKILTTEGIIYFRSKIRQEHKEKIDLYLPFVTAAIGIIGAITGLVAVLTK
ncbi:MAG: hypothetical protein KKH22_05415 [Proteobacteria bacterium]|nr:hypothetical protein [Pseudomonadota bacterium]